MSSPWNKGFRLDTGIFIALINPAMSLVFAAAFFVLWRHQRDRRYILVLCLAFTFVGCGFLLQYFTLVSVEASRLVANLLFLGGGVGMVWGSFGRYDHAPPWRAIAAVIAVGFSVFLWFLLAEPSLTGRIYAINFTFGALTLLMTAELRAVRGRQPIDNVLLGTLTFWGVTYFIRPVAVVWLDGPYVDYENFYESLYWITLIFSTALLMVVFALTLITAIALDVMEELRRESQTDSLSGLLNRRGFEDGAAAALIGMQRKGLPATLIVCDLDRFKAINDTYGHSSGDSVIAAFAGCLNTAAGRNHRVGRVGGEEFAVLLTGMNAVAGRLFAEGVRTTFRELAVPGLPRDERFTASFGVAEWLPDESIADLFARADAALYAAKNAGRDRVRVAAPVGASASAAQAVARIIDFATGAPALEDRREP